MSFGSQGELAHRSYAEAARRLNILCVNGEGGELSDMMDGRYKANAASRWRRAFGVNAQFLNSACVLEIKIGQGAARRGRHAARLEVTPQVAKPAARTPTCR